ncbi:helix-turn-helix domain-containing protein [Oceanobacillus sp. CFH 90083]|uniref:helix-turn-helix domain-containing protein n=1 Tax=Oceanobacillus sp. CFH 90083 TaxID=2592336 RepID=UPI00351A26C0
MKLEFLRMISRMKIDPAKMAFLYGFFEAYLKLNEKEEEQVMQKIDNLPEEEKEVVLQLPNSYFDKGKQEGLEKGRQEIALKLIAKGMPISQIAEITNLSKEEIEKLADA